MGQTGRVALTDAHCRVRQTASGKLLLSTGAQLAACDHPGAGGRSGEAQEGGDVCLLMTDSCCRALFQKLSTSAIFYTGLESLVYRSY